jgi:hypothetical protein
VSTARRVLIAAPIAALCCVAVACTALAAVAYPQPLFTYRATQGRLWLYSDRPFDAIRANDILADVERRLTRSSLNDEQVHRIFIANSEWRRRMVFLWNMGAAGVNYYPLTRNVFVGRADINGGSPAHRIVHAAERSGRDVEG